MQMQGLFENKECCTVRCVKTNSAPSAEPEAHPELMTSLRFTVFDALCENKELVNDAQIARALDITQGHLSRMRAGECGAGRKVIRNALKLFSPVKYDDLFCDVPRLEVAR
jgi:hypothetical protein